MHWKKDPEYNRIYIMVQQNYANDLLQARGHLFLNEVYDWLDVGRTKAGAVVGWVKEAKAIIMSISVFMTHLMPLSSMDMNEAYCSTSMSMVSFTTR